LYIPIPVQHLDLSHSGVIRLKCYMSTSFHLVRPRIIPYWERYIYFDIICNIPNCRLIGDFHTSILYTVTLHSTPCWLKPSVSSPFGELDNLLLRSMTVLTNQHMIFLVRFVLTHIPINFPKSLSSHNFSKSNILNYRVFKW